MIDFNTDLQALADHGLSGLRQHRLARITRQAYEQGALLSYEDIAMILTTSPSTVRRDVYALNHGGMFVITRGAKLDMGPGISHKTTIIDYYFKGYSFTEIERMTNHSEVSVKRYLADFVQVASLCKQEFSPNQIRMIALKSDRLIREYIELYKAYSALDNERMSDLLTPQIPHKVEGKKTTQYRSGGKGND